MLAIVGILNGYGHFHVIGCPSSCIVFPLPLPALTRGRGWVIETPSNWTDGSCNENTTAKDSVFKAIQGIAPSKERFQKQSKVSENTKNKDPFTSHLMLTAKLTNTGEKRTQKNKMSSCVVGAIMEEVMAMTQN